MNKVVLLGKGSLAIKVAQWLQNNKNYSLVMIIPDMPEPTWTDSLLEWAINNDVPYVKSGQYNDIPNDLKIDLAISVFYGKIVSKKFINRCGNIINLHNAPLPKYRGVRPINWALKNNEKYHGVTIHKIYPGIDNGAILGKVMYPIYPEIEEVRDVYKKALEYGWLLFKDVMSKYPYTIKNAEEQEEEGSSYYSMKQNSVLAERSGFTRGEWWAEIQ